jgi:restriction system protein
MKFLVECKRYSTMKVGVEVIRIFKHVIDKANANRGIFVTTSYFTKGAINEQKDYPYLLDYRDKDKVLEWIKGYFNDIV